MGAAGGDDSDSSSSDGMSTEETTPVKSSDIHAILEAIRKDREDRRIEAEGFKQTLRETKEELKKDINKMHKQLKKLNSIVLRTQSEQLNGSSGDGSPAPRSEPNHMQPPRFSLKIKSKMKDAVEKGNSIITDDGDSIVVDLYDGDNLIAPSHPLASARVMMVVLDGKFNNSRCSWSKEDFEKSIKRPREGNSATGDVNQRIDSIVSNCVFHLDGGTRRHSGATIWENSGNSKVKLGVMVLPGDSCPEERVLEGVSEKSFHVRDVPKKLKKQRVPKKLKKQKQAPVGTAGNISGQPQLQAYTNMPSSSSTPRDNTLGAASTNYFIQQQSSSFSEVYHHISGVQMPMISDSMNPDGQMGTLDALVQQRLRGPIGGPYLEHTALPVQLLWDRPGVEPSKRWNLLDQLWPLHSSQTKIHSGDFPTMHLMPEHYDSLTTYSQGPYQRLFFNEQALFLENMMRDLQITTIPKEVMQTHRNRGVLIQPLEPDDSDDEPSLKRKLRNKYQLRFVNKVCEAYYTGEKIKADDGNLLNVALYDENNTKITSGPLSSASVEVVVLHGDFNATGQDYWASEEFSSCVVCPQSTKEPPAIGGDRVLVLVDGQASLGDAFFQKSSIYARTGKFKMGVMLASTPDGRVQEGISEPFWVWNRKGGRTGCTAFQRWHRVINAITFISRLRYVSRKMRGPLLSRDTGDACLELLKEQQCMQGGLLDAWTRGAEGFRVQHAKAAGATPLDPRNKGTPYHKMLKKRDILNVQSEEYLPFADVKENDNEDAAEEAHDGNSGKEKMEIVCENTVSLYSKQAKLSNFVPVIRSGDWSDIGGRNCMEDAHVCISDLAKNFGYDTVDDEIISFYGVFDGHGGKDAARYVCDNLPRVIVEDSDFPLELEKVVRRSFVQTDSQFAETCSRHHALSSGTTALTAMIFGRSLLVANAGDCRAVLSRRGIAIEMSKDHRTSCLSERKRVESLGGYVDDGYLNGRLVVTRALGDWHIEDMKKMGETGGPLSAEPELKMITLTKDDEFLIIGSDGIWDVFSNRNAVDFARRRLQEHNDLILCCKEFVDEAIRRGSTDNLTVVMVSFHQEAPPQIKVNRTAKVERSISAEGLCSLRELLEGQ